VGGVAIARFQVQDLKLQSHFPHGALKKYALFFCCCCAKSATWRDKK
jgi:hypothetical protein